MTVVFISKTFQSYTSSLKTGLKIDGEWHNFVFQSYTSSLKTFLSHAVINATPLSTKGFPVKLKILIIPSPPYSTSYTSSPNRKGKAHFCQSFFASSQTPIVHLIHTPAGASLLHF